MRSAWLLMMTVASTSFGQSAWDRQPTSVGVGVTGRWTKDVVTGGSGRTIAVSGAGPAMNLSGSFGWSRGAFRLGGLGSYELMIDPSHDLDVRSNGPLLPLTESALRVRTAHFFSLGPFLGAQLGSGDFFGFADVAVLVDLMAAELDEVGTRLGLRFVPTARVGFSVDLGLCTFELWAVGSTLVTPRIGVVMAVGFH
ncbi:MAG: hypothetical protein JNJ54_10765 [Myxococcaceae bacterium]|nr:hypothetical protein [Myxococcaceae bacterium]